MTFRSLQMSHYQLILPRQSAYMTMNLLGQQHLLHIVSHNNLSDRPFHQMVKRCEESLQRITILQKSLKQFEYIFEEYDQSEPLFMEQLHHIWKQQSDKLGVDESKLFDIYENQINVEYQTHQNLTQRLDKIRQQKQQILENIACAETVKDFFGSGSAKRQSVDYYESNIAQAYKMQGISYMVAVIEPESELRLNKMIYRVSRGYACTKTLTHFQYDPLQNFESKVMLIIYPTSESSVLKKKIKKVVETFSRRTLDMNQIQGSQSQNLSSLKQQYNETQNIWLMTTKQFMDFMEKIKDLSYIQKWRIYLWKQKALYQSLNKMQERQQFYLGEIYVPKKKIAEISIKMNRIVPAPSIHYLPLGTPPTAFDTNSYTAISQQIVNTYGVPRYQQINPSIFTTVTFPFFFGVMFGDIGHGSLLFILGIYLIFNDEKVKKSKMKFFSDLRYIVTMMGFFAVYCGFIYNDLIGFNVNLFGSCFDPPPHPQSTDIKIPEIQKSKDDCVYFFGIDPIWGRAQNQLNYVNSLKMKLSVVIAIIHMTMGICLKASNAIYFRKKLDLYFQFIPQVIFMVLLFGYMDFLIIFKWLKPWDEVVGDIPSKQWAPSIITTMMNIGLQMGKTGDQPNGSSNMWGQRGNTSQDIIQVSILIIAFICIPVMLLPKPIIQISQFKKHKNRQPLSMKQQQQLYSRQQLQEKLNERMLQSQISQPEQQHDASQIFVHQLIQTIQFALGAVSNTASYLRLWALSLAHGQLAKVFYNYTGGMVMGTKYIQIGAMLIGFWLLCWISFGIIVCMDSMECFLHSLRLHWVQFQNKFYKGDGYKYEPFDYKYQILKNKEDKISL